MDYDLILIRYGELSLKSTYVRKQFESILIRNIKNVFKLNDLQCKIDKERGRIYLYANEISKALNILGKIFGITSFSPVIKTTSDINSISLLALEICKKSLKKENSFALRITRTGDHEFSSQDVAIKVGNEIVKATNATVNLTKPDFELFIEIRNDKSFIFIEKIPGPGGLPLGSQGKVLAFIDSNQSILAAWYLMRRGCETIFANVNSSNNKTLNSFIFKWHVNSELIEFNKIGNYYGSLEKIASTKNCEAIVTGHTLYSDDGFEDIKLLKENINFPILSPLIAMNNKDIGQKCKDIGLKT